MKFRCPNCNNQVEILDKHPVAGIDTEVVTCPSCNSRISLSDDPETTQVSFVGQEIGQFEIRKVLGEGAFGTVYHAWDRELHRDVAIKVPRPERVTKSSAKQFLREARAAAQIKHPNIVQVYEVGQLGDALYIVSEFIDGITLSEWLKIRTVNPREAAALMVTICRAVQAAHAAGVVHRDLKPGNVLMDQQSVPHVADFGLARRETGADITVTQDGRIVGTPSYMSPEQARGDNDQISAASDVWALGVTFYELLTGQRPFSATSSHTVLYRILTEDAKSPRQFNKSVPKDLETIVQKAMDKNSAARYATAGEMADDLQRHLDGHPILARPLPIHQRWWRAAQRNPTTTLLAAIVLLAPLAFVLQAFLLTGSSTATVTSVGVANDLVPFRIGVALVGENLPAVPGCSWAIMPLDRDTRRPTIDGALRLNDVASIDAALPAGEYLVVVDVPDFGFHEVYRTIPPHGEPLLGLQFNHIWSTRSDDGTVLLPSVPVRRTSDVEATMVRIPGGTFQMGDDRKDRLRHEETVADFLIDPTEVTCDTYAQFRDLPGDYKLPTGSYPVVEQSWNIAAAAAEFFGKRLLTEAEFEYAATNRGTTKFPNGDAPVTVDGRWEYLEAGQPAADRMRDFPVFGLHSNVAEWTDSLMVPYPGMAALPPDVRVFAQFDSSHVVRGGPVIAGQNDRAENTWTEPPAARMAWTRSTRDSEIGFRFGRSAKPRLINTTLPREL